MSSSYSVERSFEFDAAHRVLRHESKCATLHGHRYKVIVRCVSTELDAVGRVIDFGAVKDLLGAWLDETFDHTVILHPEDPLRAVDMGPKRVCVMPAHAPEPTAENLARVIAEEAAARLQGVRVHSVTVWETPKCAATWYV